MLLLSVLENRIWIFFWFKCFSNEMIIAKWIFKLYRNQWECVESELIVVHKGLHIYIPMSNSAICILLIFEHFFYSFAKISENNAFCIVQFLWFLHCTIHSWKIFQHKLWLCKLKLVRFCSINFSISPWEKYKLVEWVFWIWISQPNRQVIIMNRNLRII